MKLRQREVHLGMAYSGTFAMATVHCHREFSDERPSLRRPSAVGCTSMIYRRSQLRISKLQNLYCHVTFLEQPVGWD